jgi:tetratricopeptide (TPR) repeat protein
MRRPSYCWPHLVILLLVGGAVGLLAQSRSQEENLGPQLFTEGDYAAAEAAFTLQLKGDRNTPATYYNRALARFNQQNYAGAKADLSAYLALTPMAAEGFVFRANVCLLLGDMTGAIADADTVLKGSPDDHEALLVRGRARTAQGRYDAALADFSQVLQSQPKSVTALICRGDVLLARGDVAAAMADFASAAEFAPQEPDAYYKLGLAHFRLMEFAESSRAFAKAATLTAGSPLVARALGYAYYAAGEYPEASAAFQRTISLDPANSVYARFALHLTERRLGLPASPAADISPTNPHYDWLVHINRYLSGEVTEDALLLGAQNLLPAEARAGRFCEAYFYIGSLHLLTGDTSSARNAFLEAVATNQSAYTEHTLARAELTRLKDPPAPPNGRPTRRR